MPTLTGCTVVCRRQPDRRRLRLGEVPISRNKTSGHTTWLDVERPQLPVGLPETKPLDRASARVGIDTVDSFFDSLAADFGCRTVAVVLSGTGADGAAGAVRVKQAGGMVLVQDPVTAMHDGMPKAAIAGGAARPDHAARRLGAGVGRLRLARLRARLARAMD